MYSSSQVYYDKFFQIANLNWKTIYSLPHFQEYIQQKLTTSAFPIQTIEQRFIIE